MQQTRDSSTWIRAGSLEPRCISGLTESHQILLSIMCGPCLCFPAAWQWHCLDNVWCSFQFLIGGAESPSVRLRIESQPLRVSSRCQPSRAAQLSACWPLCTRVPAFSLINVFLIILWALSLIECDQCRTSVLEPHDHFFELSAFGPVLEVFS